PTILSSKADTITAKLQWLQDVGGRSPQDIVEVIRKQPSVLGLNPVNNMAPKLAWLKEMWGIGDDVQAMKILHTYPTIFCASLAAMKQKPSYLGGALGLDKGESIELLRRAPSLMVLCIDRNLRPKLDFFFTEMRASQEQV
ncbi:unnamed protein product, partial [Ectocarpus sp. 12 AP-2014]